MKFDQICAQIINEEFFRGRGRPVVRWQFNDKAEESPDPDETLVINFISAQPASKKEVIQHLVDRFGRDETLSNKALLQKANTVWDGIMNKGLVIPVQNQPATGDEFSTETDPSEWMAQDNEMERSKRIGLDELPADIIHSYKDYRNAISPHE